MSRHAQPRLPSRAGIALRGLLAVPWPSLLLALLVALVACASTLWPRFILDMNSRQLPYQISALSAQQRDLSAVWSASIVPAPDQVYPSAQETWGSLLDGLEQARRAQPEPLRSMMQPGQFFIDLGGEEILRTPPEGTRFARVTIENRIDPLLPEHVDLVSGEWPQIVLNPSPQLPAESIPEGTASGPVQVLLLDQAAQELGLQAGDEFGLRKYEEFADYLLAGTFTPHDPEDARWEHMPNSISVGELYSGDLGLLGLFTAYLPPANPGSTGPMTTNSMQLFYPLDAQAVQGNEVDTVTAQLIALSSTQLDLRLPDDPGDFDTQVNSPNINLAQPPVRTTFSTEVLSTFETLSQQQRATASILAVVAAGPIGVALAVFALAARLITSRRQPTMALAAARGASPAQARGVLALEGLLIGAPAAVLGHYAAGLAGLPASGWGEWVAVALIGLAPVVLLAMTTSTADRSTRRDLSSRAASRLRVLVEVVVLALAGMAVWRLFDRGLTGVTQTGAEETSGGTAAAPAVNVDTGVDLLMAATPILLALAACVITLRLYPAPIHALMGFFRGRRGLTNFLGAARAVRDPAGGVIPALAVILGVSVAVLSSVLVSTISTGTEAGVWRTTGADVRLSGPAWTDDDVAALRDVEGVADVAAVRPAANNVALRGEEVTANGLTVYIVDNTLPQVWADAPVPSLPEALFADSPGTPVLTGGKLEADSGAGILDGLGQVDIVGHVDDLPGVRTRGEFLVVDRAQWEAAGGTTPRGEVVLVKADDPDQTESLAAALHEAVPNALAETPAEQLEVFSKAPVSGTMLWLFVAAVVATGALTVLAVLFVQLLGAQARTSLIAVLRTLGLSQRQARGLTAWELGPLVAMAFGVGAVLGLIVPWLLLRAIDLTGLTGGAEQPALALNWVVLGPVAVGILAAVAIAIAVSATLSGRADLTNQLRRGEER